MLTTDPRFDLLTTSEAADLLGICRDTLRKLPIPKVRLGEGVSKYRRETLAKFLEDAEDVGVSMADCERVVNADSRQTFPLSAVGSKGFPRLLVHREACDRVTAAGLSRDIVPSGWRDVAVTEKAVADLIRLHGGEANLVPASGPAKGVAHV